MQRILIPLTPISRTNKRFEDYKKECSVYLKNVDPYLDACNMCCKFYIPAQSADMSKLLTGISEILSDYGILINNTSKYIKGYDGSRVLYDREKPRTEIILTEFGKEDKYE